MELIKWSDEMSVNIKEIDDQHKKLIEIINNLFIAMLEGKAQDIINKTVDELINYAEYHFSTEENYFEKHNYPGFHSHKIQHSYYKDEILNYKQELLNGKSTVPTDVFNFLKDWLTEHIMNSDKKYSKYLNNKGVF
ncbi:MAG: hemerythrin family protein [Calditrichia bacterium]|nr:hemerythrin family protein [Calditrichia bacterium]